MASVGNMTALTPCWKKILRHATGVVSSIPTLKPVCRCPHSCNSSQCCESRTKTPLICNRLPTCVSSRAQRRSISSQPVPRRTQHASDMSRIIGGRNTPICIFARANSESRPRTLVANVPTAPRALSILDQCLVLSTVATLG